MVCYDSKCDKANVQKWENKDEFQKKAVTRWDTKFFLKSIYTFTYIHISKVKCFKKKCTVDWPSKKVIVFFVQKTKLKQGVKWYKTMKYSFRYIARKEKNKPRNKKKGKFSVRSN